MAEVWDLEVDEDMTLRSQPYSKGLYATEQAAIAALEALQLEGWMWRRIFKREIIGSSTEEFSAAIVALQKSLQTTMYERDLALEALSPFATITWPKGKLKIELKQ